MRNFAFSILIIILAQYVLTNCANPQAPTGGPKDTIPPTLLEAYPQMGTINFQGQEITLEFDEAVKADRLQSNLIITPRQEVKFKTITKKNRLIIKFQDPFPDSTTITLNFLEGVTDVTENNPAVNLSYVFSTGDYLDSLSISGTTFTLLDNIPQESITIGLYSLTDSLNFQKDKPTYFIKSDKKGRFKISNIKMGTYRLLAFDDENNNLTFEGKQESFGFLSDTIQLDSNIQDISIPLIKQNVSELKLISSRTNTHYYDIRYSKSLSAITIQPHIDHKFDLETSTLKLYKPQNLDFGDSLQAFITVTDSLYNQTRDTLYVKFNESDRKRSAFEFTMLPKDNNVLPSISFNFQFSKPVTTFDSTKLSFKRDSTINIHFNQNQSYQWSSNRTSLKFEYVFDTTSYYQKQKVLYDSLVAIRTAQLDTMQFDSTNQRPSIKEFHRTNQVTLHIPEGTFISIEEDTLKALQKNYTFYGKNELGSILLALNGFEQTDIVELIDKKFQTIKSVPYSNSISFQNVIPGEYGIRILIDSNKDGNWSIGNLLKNIEPEEVFVYPEFTSLRANWEINLNISKN